MKLLNKLRYLSNCITIYLHFFHLNLIQYIKLVIKSTIIICSLKQHNIHVYVNQDNVFTIKTRAKQNKTIMTASNEKYNCFLTGIVCRKPIKPVIL